MNLTIREKKSTPTVPRVRITYMKKRIIRRKGSNKKQPLKVHHGNLSRDEDEEKPLLQHQNDGSTQDKDHLKWKLRMLNGLIRSAVNKGVEDDLKAKEQLVQDREDRKVLLDILRNMGKKG